MNIVPECDESIGKEVRFDRVGVPEVRVSYGDADKNHRRQNVSLVGRFAYMHVLLPKVNN
jgi:hypothetical protein